MHRAQLDYLTEPDYYLVLPRQSSALPKAQTNRAQLGGADGEIRTLTGLLLLASEASVSTISPHPHLLSQFFLSFTIPVSNILKTV